MRRWARITAGLAAGCAAALLLGWTASAADVDAPLQVRKQANTASAQAQQRVDAIADETERLVSEYRTALEQIEALRTYNGQMDELIAAQRDEMQGLKTQIDQVEVVGRGMLPLMLRMIEALREFVGLDVPMLLEERRDRVAALEDLMGRADVTDAERYRRILEAYQIENDLGRTIEAYRGELVTNGTTRTVDFLRLGRVALFYQTLDGAEVGAWDPETKSWVQLAGEHRSEIRRGIRIARKQAAPDLLRLPLPAPKDAL